MESSLWPPTRCLLSSPRKIPPFLSFSLVVAFDLDLWQLEVGHAVVLRPEDDQGYRHRPERGRGHGVRGRRGRRRRRRLRRRDDEDGRDGRKAAKVNECKYMHGACAARTARQFALRKEWRHT